MTTESQRLFDEAFLRRLERVALLTRRTASGQLQGERRSQKRGQSVEFADYRLYVPGDDFRRVDWNAYARLERLFIKLYIEEQDLTVHILVDASRSMDWGEPSKLGYTLKLAGALGYVALLGLDRVTLTVLGTSLPRSQSIFPPTRGKQSAVALFRFLQALPVGSGELVQPDPLTWLSAYAASANRPGPLVLISDMLNDGWQPGLNLLAGRNFEITLLHLLSPDELAPDLSGDFRLLDSEGGASVELTADSESMERYNQALRTWQSSWRRFCAARSIQYLPVSTELPLEDLLFAGLPRLGVLR